MSKHILSSGIKLDHHLTAAEGFGYPSDPRSFVVRGLFAPVRVTQGKLVLDEGADKVQFKKTPMIVTTKELCTLPGGGVCKQTTGGRALSMEFVWVQPGRKT